MNLDDSSVKVIYDEPGIFKRQVAERRVFNLDLFNTETAVFPRRVFNRHFDSYRFMIFDDWFHTADDYGSLISFLNSIRETNFYASCPPPFLVNPVAFTSKATHEEFKQGIRYGHSKDHHSKDILTSPETFYYGESERWAIVLDITNNVYIVGLEATTIDAFESAFEGKFFDEQGVIDWLMDWFKQFHQLSAESLYEANDKEQDTLNLVRRNYGNKSLPASRI